MIEKDKKKVFVFCWSDKNFGDDMFIDILTRKFNNIDFYAKSNIYSDEFATRYDNLYTSDNYTKLIKENFFDSYLLVGGDMFPEFANYNNRLNTLKLFKQQGKPISFIGCSFKHNYSHETIEEIKKVCDLADSIVIRDKFSYNFLKKLKVKNIVLGSDIVFSMLENINFEFRKSTIDGLLGISIRRASHINNEIHEAYCTNMSNLINKYLDKDKKNTVSLLCFSTGSIDDTEVANKIKNNVKSIDRVKVVEYDFDINYFTSRVYECEYILATRFHALIFSLIFEKRFIPFIYEDKTLNLLEDIEFSGVKLNYENFRIAIAQALESLNNKNNEQFNLIKLQETVQRSNLNFQVKSLNLEVK